MEMLQPFWRIVHPFNCPLPLHMLIRYILDHNKSKNIHLARIFIVILYWILKPTLWGIRKASFTET